MDGSKIGEFGKFGREQNLKSIVINGVKIGKVGKLGNYRIDEEMRGQIKERLRKSSIKCLARHSREKRAMSAEVEEKNKTSYALMMSLARSCCGTLCARLVDWS